MGRLRRFIEALRPDQLMATGSVFPRIDAERIAADLAIEQTGRRDGKDDQPRSSATLLSPIEHRIIAEVARLRMDGFNRYSEHMETYARRLREASNSKAELRSIAQTVLGDYEKSVAEWRNTVHNAYDRVRDRHQEREMFRREHRLTRTAHDQGSLIMLLGVALMLVLVESAMNGYFFAAGNELGLLGGVSVALVISLVNVGFSSVFGYLSRNANHVRWLRRLFGTLLILLAILSGLTFNLAVAHFREAAGHFPWDQAVVAAVRSFKEAPLGIENIESWLLFCIGLLICVVAFWKAWAFDDPYPDYGRVHRRIESAREDYGELVADAYAELESLRDDAVGELDEARRVLSQNIAEAIDVVYAQAGLREQLRAFLEHAEQGVNQVLAIYRSANLATRTTDPPGYFARGHRFDELAGSGVITAPPQDRAQQELDEIERIVTDTIDRIAEQYRGAVHSFRSLTDIEGSDRQDRAGGAGNGPRP